MTMPAMTTQMTPTLMTGALAATSKQKETSRHRTLTRTRPSTMTATGRRTEDGPEGKPLRVPLGRDHRLEVAVVRGPQLPGLRHRRLENPRLPDGTARSGRRQPDRDRAHP